MLLIKLFESFESQGPHRHETKTLNSEGRPESGQKALWKYSESGPEMQSFLFNEFAPKGSKIIWFLNSISLMNN